MVSREKSFHPWFSPTDPFEVRLVGGLNDAEGRVEVLYDGSWGTICDSWWDLRDARVVCRMLGFDGALNAPRSARFGQGSGRILLKYVTCDGTEDNLAECTHSGIGRYSCSHTRDAGAICYSGLHPKPFEVRLVGGSNNAEGTVEIMHDGSWETICDVGWDLRDARVICRMLGFDGALDAPGSARFGQGSDPFQVRLVNGSNDAEGRVEILYDGFWGTICDDWWDIKDARVVCRMMGFNDAIAASISARFGQGPGHSLLTSLGFQLVNGAHGYEGRVEILHEGSWGTVCDDFWDLDDAKVVCRQLGFDGAVAALPRARFGQGSGDIFLDGVQCNGTKTSLRYCQHKGIGVHHCTHEGDASVICKRGGLRTYSDMITSDEIPPTYTTKLVPNGHETTTVPSRQQGHKVITTTYPLNTNIRLVNGSNNAEGRVEIFYGGSWMTVCDKNWDLLAARVVCRMLGFDGALDATRSASFGQGSGGILYVKCFGTEDSLADCYRVSVVSSCKHKLDAGAVCYSGVGGASDAEGRVEVLYDGSWGTICDSWWDLTDARVVCRMLGFDGALDAPGSARFGQGSGRSLLGYVNCDGNEDNVADCAHAGIGRYSCSHTRDAGAICYSGLHPNPFKVHLVGGSNEAEGRVEVLQDGSWGTVCGVGWDLRDARVVCRMLGLDGALDAPRSANFGQGSGRILLQYVNCDGTEDNLADCAHAGVEPHPTPFQVRLVNGLKDAEGRVEVLYDGSWGTICDSWWDLRDARVVCRMMGFDGALDAPGSARFGQGSGRILLKYVNCDGTEDNLADCTHSGIGRYSCSHTRDAGAICYSGLHPKPFEVRLVGGSNEAEGRVEVMYEGSWGTICDDSWDLRDARVVCIMLGFDGALNAPRSARFGQGSGHTILDVLGCDGTEVNLAECALAWVESYSCGHTRDAGAVCHSGDPFQVRLVNGSNDAEGRVEVLYEGSWGTICDDSWDLKDARVVCRMMGFNDATAAPTSAKFGQGPGHSLLTSLGCGGNEDSLADCFHAGFDLSMEPMDMKEELRYYMKGLGDCMRRFMGPERR
ncbi:deleted in malignant brain tumors 1 protein-like [Strongylocentrotus purpuratus]|uniref:SRCR domain-containing protein n=1 Tax=Strongylocentrotus purpuratus TaxID=7668 RepID=A0A7M7PIH7_STRPU|nr:deleted in malignant brain tumors 1 protein-like [Strongylocentrotus purpuratus]